MIAPQTFETYDIFGSGATKVEPPAAKRSAGFQQADVLPAEWMNWAWYKNSKGINDLNDGLGSVENEIKTVLDNAGITPNASNNDQLYKAVQKNNGCIITAAATPAVITGAPAIEAGNVIKIMFGGDVIGANAGTALTISYNGSAKTVKVCKNGAPADVFAHEITSGTFKYIQANTVMEFVYDGTYLVVVGNPVVLSGTDYTIYADGKIGNEEVGSVKAKATNETPYGWLPCDGRSVLRADYPDLFEKFNTQTYDGTHTLLSRYGSADATHFNLPDFREVALVGIGTNGTDGISNHDAYTLGQFKNDEVKSFSGSFKTVNRTAADYTTGVFGATDGSSMSTGQYADALYPYKATFNIGNGDVTRGKRKGVNYLIKVM